MYSKWNFTSWSWTWFRRTMYASYIRASLFFSFLFCFIRLPHLYIQMEVWFFASFYFPSNLHIRPSLSLYPRSNPSFFGYLFFLTFAWFAQSLFNRPNFRPRTNENICPRDFHVWLLNFLVGFLIPGNQLKRPRFIFDAQYHTTPKRWSEWIKFYCKLWWERERNDARKGRYSIYIRKVTRFAIIIFFSRTFSLTRTSRVQQIFFQSDYYYTEIKRRRKEKNLADYLLNCSYLMTKVKNFL